MIDIIASTGRIADKSDRTLIGARQLAGALEELHGVAGRHVGSSTFQDPGHWRIDLDAAKENLEALATEVEHSISSGIRIVLVGGTCSVGLASLPVVARHFPDVVVLWIDAHGDFNTPDTTKSGYLGGMALSAVCGCWDSGHGAGVDAGKVVLLGARDFDSSEYELITSSGATILAPHQCRVPALLDAIGQSPVWVHIDWDVLDPGYVSADYAVGGGLSTESLKALIAAINPRQIVGLEIAEFNSPSDRTVAEQQIQTILDMVSPIVDDLGTL